MRKPRKIPKQNLTRDWYLDSVYGDPEFKSDADKLEAIALKEKYKLSDEEVEFYKSGYYAKGRFINRRKSLELYSDGDKNEVVIRVGKDATLTDFKLAWPLIKAMRWSMYGQEESRNKPPENPDIVYGVFKLWVQKKNRNEIFEIYESGKLTDKEYNSQIFNTPKELMDYCRPYFKVVQEHALISKSD